MKTKTILTIIILGVCLNTFGQRNSLKLVFTAINNVEHVQLDSIKIINRINNTDTTLFWPDTILELDYQTGIQDINGNFQNFYMKQNYPNPVKEQTTISLMIPEKENVNVTISNIYGYIILKKSFRLEKGIQYFRFTPGKENMYFVTSQWKDKYNTIKVLNSTSNLYQTISFDYMDSEVSTTDYKSTENQINFSFNIGDELLYIGYSNEKYSGISDIPEESQTYPFQFATNIPCPDALTVEYEGTTYNTVQIYSQCWLKENLNVGTMILGNEWTSNNNVIEKYCLGNTIENCQKYGGLYSWWEMMQYTTEEGTQGICPDGWHIPTDNEWKILEGSVDSQYGIGSITWDIWGHRGFDGGTNLKSESDWGYGTDLFDFSGLPGGIKWGNSTWSSGNGFWWSSTENNNNGAWYRILSTEKGIERRSEDNSLAISMRCIKD